MAQPVPDMAPRTRLGRVHRQRPWIGRGMYLLAAGWFLTQVAVAWVWHHPTYSLVRNTISDLGNTACHAPAYPLVCSPRHWWMNAAFWALGAFMIAGSLLVRTEFTERAHPDPLERRGALAGFACLAVAGIGSVVVGVFPENGVHLAHVLGAAAAIGLANVGIFLLGLCLCGLPEALRRYMLVFSCLSLTALVCFAGHRYFGIGPGGMERVAAYPEILWLVIFGIYVAMRHRRPAPPGTAVPG